MTPTTPEQPTPPDGAAKAEDLPQVAVWYFIVATFVFAAPSIWFRDAGLWVTIASLAVGMLIVVLGGIRLGREVAARQATKAARQPGVGEPPAA